MPLILCNIDPSLSLSFHYIYIYVIWSSMETFTGMKHTLNAGIPRKLISWLCAEVPKLVCPPQPHIQDICRPQGTRGARQRSNVRRRASVKGKNTKYLKAWRARRSKNKREAKGKANERRKPAARASQIASKMWKKTKRKRGKQTKEEKFAR